MTNRERGFTLIELMIVIAVIAIIAAIALPNLLSARLTANESAAIATLNNIASAQSQCRSSGAIDVNGNGAGEYAYFAELAGFAPVRGGLQRIAPPVLSSAFANVTARRVTRSGYVFQMYLPGVAADGVAEDPLGGDIDNGNGDKVAIIFEADGGEVTHVTYKQLYAKVCALANGLKSLGYKKGDRALIYMPMSVEGVVAMQACARLGVIH